MFTSPTRVFGGWAMGLAAIAVVLLVTGLPSSEKPDNDEGVNEERTDVRPAPVAPPVTPSRAETSRPRPEATSVVASSEAIDHELPASRPLVARPTMIAETDPVLPVETAETSAERSPIASATAIRLVTITGCLENDKAAFRLKDTDGAEVPKSRSWKSGFLTKRPASLIVVDSTDKISLQGHVGRRVALTGTVTEREMQVRSLRPVASSCD